MYETSDQYPEKYTARYTRTPEGKLLSIYIYRPVGDYYNYYYIIPTGPFRLSILRPGL